jgi:hypothetical protein
MGGTWRRLVLWGMFTGLGCLGLIALAEPALRNMALLLIAVGAGGLLCLAGETLVRNCRKQRVGDHDDPQAPAPR